VEPGARTGQREPVLPVPASAGAGLGREPKSASEEWTESTAHQLRANSVAARGRDDGPQAEVTFAGEQTACCAALARSRPRERQELSATSR